MSQYTDKISVEIFPPKKDVDFSGIFSVIDELSLLNPEFISVTYGAGGSQAGKTLETASYIQNEKHLPAIAHLTCVGNTKADIDKVLVDLEKAGINRILALRGDRPTTMTDEQFNSMEFAHANELVSHIKNHNSKFDEGALEEIYSFISSNLTLTNLLTPDSCIVIPYNTLANSIVFFL